MMYSLENLLLDVANNAMAEVLLQRLPGLPK